MQPVSFRIRLMIAACVNVGLTSPPGHLRGVLREYWEENSTMKSKEHTRRVRGQVVQLELQQKVP